MKRMIFVAGLLTAVLCGTALAAGDPDAAKGLLVENCVSCHRMPGHARPEGVAELGAPPFLVIAQAKDRYPRTRLRTFLRRPHWPMSRFNLSARDIDNILTYFESLRGN